MAIRALRPDAPDPGQTPKAEIVTITPELAGDWLALAGTNRRLFPRVVANYATAMERGEWQVTGESIKFDTAGRLVDGQHRLSAVVQSGISIQSLVVRGVAPDAFDVMDSGRLRSPADVLGMHGYGNAKLLAAITANIMHYQIEGNFHRSDRGGVSKPTILRFVQDHPRLVEVTRIITSSGPRFLGTPPALIGALYYLFEFVDDEDAGAFFDKLRTGADLHATDPIFLLRRRLIDNSTSTSRLTQNITAALFIKAWNHWREGSQLKNLSYRPGGSAPEPFPVIK